MLKFIFNPTEKELAFAAKRSEDARSEAIEVARTFRDCDLPGATAIIADESRKATKIMGISSIFNSPEASTIKRATATWKNRIPYIFS